MVPNERFELPTFSLQVSSSTVGANSAFNGGPSRDRTDNLLLAGQVLSQLRYEPIMADTTGFEPAT